MVVGLIVRYGVIRLGFEVNRVGTVRFGVCLGFVGTYSIHTPTQLSGDTYICCSVILHDVFGDVTVFPGSVRVVLVWYGVFLWGYRCGMSRVVDASISETVEW